MSTYGLSSETKKKVKSTVLALRNLLEGEFDPDTDDPIPPGGDVAKQTARYGILVNKPESFKSENAPEYLTDEEKKKRERISAAIKREVAIFGGLSDKTALRRGMRAFIRQTSYTWINRLLGLRCMEARGLLKDDRGELDFVVTPSDDYGGLPRRAWRIKGEDPAKWQTAKLYDLQCQAINDACRQLTQEIKVLFDPEHDYGLIWPSPPALNTLLQKIQELNKIAIPSPFTSPDFLGWVYQYFQTVEKDLVFKAASKKKKKIEKDDIIAATQIYTEHYMVEHLVQNSLGRLWMEMHPDSKLSVKWAYYVKPPEENLPVESELKKAIEIKLMDPALGSGHFHLVAFDLLLDMYEEEIENAGQSGWPDTPSVENKKDIPAAILEHNLFGIDIDVRSIQLASLVLVMKARESGYEGPINHLNLVVANSAPFESEAWYQFIQNLEKEGKHSVARVLAALGTKLMNLDEFGSLLRIEEEMQKIIQEEKKQWIAQAKMGPEQDYLFPEMTKPRQEKLPFEMAITDETFFDRLGSVIHKELDMFYFKARHDGLAEEAIMAADAERGFDFARLSMQRYDAVYTNPPYMGSKNMGSKLKKFVAIGYPEGKRDLYAAFILRCRELSEQNGYVGMVTQQSWMFLRSFVKMRQQILKVNCIQAIAHLGPHAFTEISGEVVGVVLFIIKNNVPNRDSKFIALRLIAPKSKKGKEILLRSTIKGDVHSLLFQQNQRAFLSLPESPIVYWLSRGLLKVFADLKGLGNTADVRQGLVPGDVPRFVRMFWEVNKNKVRWFSYSKGGEYRRWFGLEHYVIDWENEGERIRNAPSKRVQGTDLFFKRGITYTHFASRSFNARILRSGSIFSDSAGMIYVHEANIYKILGICNSRAFTYLIRVIAPGNTFREGYIARTPVPQIKNSFKIIDILTRTVVRLASCSTSFEVTETSFDVKFDKCSNGSLAIVILSLVDLLENLASTIHCLEGLLEKWIIRSYDIEKKDVQLIIEETSTPTAWYSLISGYDALPQLPPKLPHLPRDLIEDFSSHDRISMTSVELNLMKNRLRALYIAGPGTKLKDEEYIVNEEENKKQKNAGMHGARISIPTENFIEELSQRLQIHPISVYLMLKEMREKEGLVCPSELKRYAEDYVTVTLIRMLGYQWPKQVEAGEPLPDWADDDGIIPLTDGLGEATLLDRIRKRFGADFGEEKEASIESEFANIVGKPLERWLEEDFFARHVKQFKNRPIAWHIVSDPSVVNNEAGQSEKGKKKGGKKKQKPAFSVMVHYQRFVDGDKGYGKLLLLKNKYLEKLMSQTRSELESLRGKGDDFFDRIAELDRKLVELEDFRERLERFQEGKDRESRIFVRWKSSEEQPQGWRPDINDGVKINIAPWERLGMFPVKKIVGEVEMGTD